MGYAGILGEKRFQLRHPLRLPAGHLKLPRPLLNLIGKGLRVCDTVHNGLIVGQNRCTVRPGLEEVRAGPVKHRHEVIADDLHTGLTQSCHGLAIVFNVFISAGKA